MSSPRTRRTAAADTGDMPALGDLESVRKTPRATPATAAPRRQGSVRRGALSVAVHHFTCDAACDVLDVGGGASLPVLADCLSQQSTHERGRGHVCSIGLASKLIVESSVDAQMRRCVEERHLLVNLSFGRFGFLASHFCQDRLVPGAAR